jgi:hypothetical protein
MKREVVIEFAKEAGLWDFWVNYVHTVSSKKANAEELIFPGLEKFASLVAAAELEKCVSYLNVLSEICVEKEKLAWATLVANIAEELRKESHKP